MVMLKAKEPDKVKFVMPVSPDLAEKINSLIAQVPKDFELDFDDSAKKIIKELQKVVDDLLAKNKDSSVINE